MRNRSIFLASLTALTLISLSSVSRAEHRYPQSHLQVATERLHNAADHLNQVAQHCSPTRTEAVFAGILLKKTCRLADGVRDCKSWGRVNGDFHSVKGFMRVIDKRVQRYCRSQLDYRWRAAWANVQREFEQVCFIWDNRDAICQGRCEVPSYNRHIQPQINQRLDPRFEQRFDPRLNARSNSLLDDRTRFQPRFDDRQLFQDQRNQPRRNVNPQGQPFGPQSFHNNRSPYGNEIDPRAVLINSLLQGLFR